MDRTEQYRLIVQRLIEEYATYKPSHGQIETEAIMDRDRDHYEVMHVGWDRARRVHGSVVLLISSTVRSGFSTTARRSRSQRSWSPRAFRVRTSCSAFIQRVSGNTPDSR